MEGADIRLGSRAPIRELNCVADTVDGFIRIAPCDAALGRVVNVGSGRGLKVGQMVDAVSKALGRPLKAVDDPDRVRPPTSEVEALIADAKLADQLFGWRSVTPFEEGLKRTIEWFSEKQAVLDPTKYLI